MDSSATSSFNGIIQGIYASENGLDTLVNELSEYMNTLNFVEDDLKTVSAL